MSDEELLQKLKNPSGDALWNGDEPERHFFALAERLLCFKAKKQYPENTALVIWDETWAPTCLDNDSWNAGLDRLRQVSRKVASHFAQVSLLKADEEWLL